MSTERERAPEALTFGAGLREVRVAAGLSLRDAAALLGVTPTRPAVWGEPGFLDAFRSALRPAAPEHEP